MPNTRVYKNSGRKKKKNGQRTRRRTDIIQEGKANSNTERRVNKISNRNQKRKIGRRVKNIDDRIEKTTQEKVKREKNCMH